MCFLDPLVNPGEYQIGNQYHLYLCFDPLSAVREKMPSSKFCLIRLKNGSIYQRSLYSNTIVGTEGQTGYSENGIPNTLPVRGPL